jgi:hypothetical protein
MFAVAKDITTPDEDQEARAKRVSDAIRNQLPVPEVRWQDNEAIHQDVLEREILLQDDLSPEIIAAAQERWTALANQATQKQGGGAPPPQGGNPPAGPSAASVPSLPPGQMPLAAGNPPIGVAPMMQQQMGGAPEAEVAAQQSDILSRQS